ncbi:TetR/AcrR family transcriptional regulator [Acinetobacter junii]|uniref:TetR family transcriptional regulator n=1 Tax=Acinetobacter junii TaxID=40215 RepID=UPI00403DA48F
MGKSADRIILNSISVFRDKGFSGTTVGDIATATGILKGSLYAHFASKEDILLEVINKVESLFFEYIQIKSPGNFDEILRKTADFFVQEESCLMANLLAESLPSSAQSRVIEFFKTWKSLLISAMDESIDPQSKNIFAEDVISLFEGTVIMMKVLKSPAPVNRCVEQLTQIYNTLRASTNQSDMQRIKQTYDYREVSENGNDDTLVCDICDSDNFMKSLDTSNSEHK